MKKLFLVERTDKYAYDEFDSFVVVARSEEEARYYEPSGGDVYPAGAWQSKFPSWCENPKDTEAVEIGFALPDFACGFIPIASFNAG